ncbi:MAG: hypothetical protein WAV13_04495 [Thermodesulfovibrionales bacterium]
MKKNFFVLFIIAMVIIVSAILPQAGFAEVDVNIGINVSLPAFVFSAPPAVVFIPGTYVYAVPDVDIDIVFYHGYWYRPHMDYWYRSTSYNGPWKHIDKKVVPGVLFKLPPDYRKVPPGHQRIPYGQLKKNWKTWENEKHWDKHEHKSEKKDDHKEEKKKHSKGGKGKH